MDVFGDAREIGSRFARYVVDLRRLFLFHGLACGQAENFVDLAVKLEESRALRLDLPALLRNVRDLEQGSMSADEMLTVVALASGGEEMVDGRASAAGVMRTVGLLRMMLSGVGTWAETKGPERMAQVVEEAGPGPGSGSGSGSGSGAGSESGSKEERVFLELAIEELRLQLGDVTRRMRELGPPAAAIGEKTEVESVEDGVREDGGRTADTSGMTSQAARAAEARRRPVESAGWYAGESLADERERAAVEAEAAEMGELERNAAVRAAKERAEIARVEAERVEAEVRRVEAARVEAERVEAARVEAERVEAVRVEAVRVEAARVEAERVEAVRVEAVRVEAARVEAERVEAVRVEAERAAVLVEAERAAVLERARTWPLEERVSSLPTMPLKKPLSQRAALQEGSPEKERGRLLQMGAIAAGLLLAVAGIYGSLRSAPASTEKEGTKMGAAPGGGAASGGRAAVAAGIAPAPGESSAGGLVGSAAGGVKAPVVEKGAAEARTATTQGVPRKTVTAETPRVAVVKAPEEKPRAVAKGVEEPAERKVVAPEAVAKSRRDDPAVEADVARGRMSGKYLFVPAEVMEKHLMSSRTPIVPPGAAGQGRVVLNAFIAKDGTVSRTDVVEGPAKLINSAVAAVSWRRYRPFLVGGKAAEVVTPVTVNYAER